MYRILLERKAINQLKKIPEQDLLKIKKKIYSLSKNPLPMGHVKLKGRDAYRIRQGDYRIIYEINNDLILVIVLAIGPRKNIYKR
jgi:mRNA interferase RelE/StbE